MQLLLSGEGTLQEQVFRALRDAIVAGHIAPDARLPSTRVMAENLGVSRITTLSAYERLAAEGLLYTRAGSGTFVAPFMTPRTRASGRGEPQRPLSALGQRLADFEIRGAEPRASGTEGIEFDFGQSRALRDPKTQREWLSTVRRVAAQGTPSYPDPAGDRLLREHIAALMMRWHGFACTADEVLVTSGAQQAMFLLAQVLLDPGDGVAMEDPGYASVRYLFDFLGAEINPLAVDACGADPRSLLTRRPPKLIYLTPAHQFPLGSVLSSERRMQLLDYARRSRCWVIEDDYDGQYRYVGTPVSSLKLLDDGDRVCYVGTFSKTLDPSLRLGFVVLPQALVRPMRLAKALQDQGSPALSQQAMRAFIENGAYERHLIRARKELARRRAELLEALAQSFGAGVSVFGSETGTFVAAEFGIAGKHADAFVADARRQGVFLQSAGPHYAQAPESLVLLLGYGGISSEHIAAGVAALAKILATR